MPHLARVARHLPLAVLLLVGSAGCSKKVPECNAIVGVVNPAADALKKTGEKSAAKPAEVAAQLRAMAKTATDAAGKLDKLEITTEELKKHRGDFKQLYEKLAAGCTATADAMDAADKAEAAAEKASKDIHGSTEKWSAFCADAKHAAEAPACKSMADAMQKLPNDPTHKAEADKAVGEMAKVEVKDEGGKALAKAMVAAFQASQKALADATAAEDKAKKAQASLEPLEKQESDLVGGMNKFCTGG